MALKSTEIFCAIFVIKNNTLNFCFPDLGMILVFIFRSNMILFVDNTRIFEEIPSVSKF